MARPWEYPGWRRVVMQVVMWLIFCATLGLAQLVTRSRSIDTAQQVRVGRFLVRLPSDWKIDSASAVGMRAHDPDGERRFFVAVVPLTRAEDPDAGSDDDGPARIEFKGLNRVGIIELQRPAIDIEDAQTRLVATVTVPSIRAKLRVGFNLVGADQTGAEVSLLKRIANGITLSADSPRPPQVGRPDGDVVL